MKILPVKPNIWNFEVVNGSDAWKEVVYSARVSGIPPEIDEEEVFKMIVRNDYGSALEHVIVKFNVKMSKGNAPELLEHRMSSHTGYSTRYAKVDQRYTNGEQQYEVIVPWHVLDQPEEFIRTVKYSIGVYEGMLDFGIPRESARYVLPFCQAVGIYHMTWNLRSLLNFLSLRLCVRSSPEMRCLASQIYFYLTRQLPILKGLVGCRGFMMGICPEDGVTGVRVGKQHTIYPKCPFVSGKEGKLTNTFIPTRYEVNKRYETAVFSEDEAVLKMERLFERWKNWEG